MHILYFHQHFITPKGTGGNRSYQMAKKLIQKGHQVTMVCGSIDGSGIELEGPVIRGVRKGVVEGIQVIQILLPYSNKDSFLKRTFTFLRFAFRSILIALREDYDLLFATSTPLTVAIPGIVMRLFRRKKFVFEVRDLWPELPQAMGVISNPIILKGMSLLEWLSYRLAHGVVGLSPGIVNGIRRRSRSGLPVAMIPNGCDLDLFQPQLSQSLNIEGIEEKDFVAVFTGTHGIANGLDSVLDAAIVLKKRKISNIKLLLVGDGKCKADLQSRADKENLNNCIFLDPLPKTTLNELIASCDVGLMILKNIPAFYYGTSPNKFFDYIASGLPVLNNYPGWLAEQIKDHHCGVVAPPDDPNAFVDQLLYLLQHSEERLKMGSNARELAQRSFSRDLLSEEWVQFITQINRSS